MEFKWCPIFESSSSYPRHILESIIKVFFSEWTWRIICRLWRVLQFFCYIRNGKLIANRMNGRERRTFLQKIIRIERERESCKIYDFFFSLSFSVGERSVSAECFLSRFEKSERELERGRKKNTWHPLEEEEEIYRYYAPKRERERERQNSSGGPKTGRGFLIQIGPDGDASWGPIKRPR